MARCSSESPAPDAASKPLCHCGEPAEFEISYVEAEEQRASAPRTYRRGRCPMKKPPKKSRGRDILDPSASRPTILSDGTTIRFSKELDER